MRKILIGIALVCCLFTSTAQAATTLEILPTHRQDRFTWNKAELGGAPWPGAGRLCHQHAELDDAGFVCIKKTTRWACGSGKLPAMSKKR
ncbi:MAG: hypothetical protein AB9917_18300 [Negativicutes bacterium]